VEIPAIPEYEEQRLEALLKLRILDTLPEESFDRLTRLVRQHFNVPVAQINLVDSNRVWSKSSEGSELGVVSRDQSFCAHTILGDDILYLSDTRNDPRFSSNTAMPENKAVRFYAGIPLKLYGGFNIGALCIMDSKSRRFTAAKYDAMKDFARSVEQQFNLSRLEQDGRFLISQTSRLNTLLETVADGIVTIDDGGRIESLNSSAAQIFDYDASELIGQQLELLVPSIAETGWTAYLGKTLHSEVHQGSSSNTDLIGMKKNGKLFPMDLRFREMHLEGNLLYTGIVRDVTNAKAIQDEIRVGREILEATKENIPVGLSVFDKDLCLRVINSQTPKFLDLPKELSRIGTHFGDIMAYLIARGDFGNWNTDQQKTELKKMIAQPKSQRFARIIESDRYIEISSASMPGSGFVSTYMDITRRLKNEEKLENLLQHANDANEAKTNFLSTVSHEIRTPLNGVLGVAQLLKDTQLDTDQRQKLDTILHSGNTLLELINDVLDMNKIESGSLEIEYIVCDIRLLLESIKSPFEFEAEKKGIEFQVIVDSAIAQYVIADPTRLRQIVLNLIGNAFKFTTKGQVIVTVSADRPSRDNVNNIVISVSDTGVGIAEDRQKAIFDSFSQADNSVSRKFGGTGLGLSIVKNLVTMMDGDIQVKSKEGEGARFSATFEFKLASEEEIAQQADLLEASEIKEMRSLKILVAEDNAVNALVTTSFLKKIGHCCDVAENGQLAVQMLDFEAYDLILMDVHMPVMDGVEATRQIRLKNAYVKLPIIGVTAEAFSDRHKYMREMGMTDILTKPFTKEQLQNVIASNLHVMEGSPVANINKSDEIDTADEEGLVSTLHLPVGCEDKMNEFIDQLGSEITHSIIGKTPDSIRAELNTLHEGLSAEDNTIIFRAVHTIAGVAGSMCADRLAMQASLMEQMAENPDDIKAAIPLFEQTAEETILWWNLKLEEVS